MKKVVIIGGGLAGLSTAYSLNRLGYKCFLYEKDIKAGGLCKTNKSRGYLFDYAGHWLHCKSDYVKSLLNKLTPDAFGEISRKTAIYMFDRFIKHPFQTNLKGLPDEIIVECLVEFAKAYSKSSKTNYESFYEWIMDCLGSGIAKHFMLPYNKKLWTVDAAEMTCDWMGRFVPKPDINEVFMGAIAEKKNDEGYNSKFLYPREDGIQVLSDRMAQNIDQFFLNREVNKINISDKKVYFTDGNVEEYDILVNTMPLNNLIDIIENNDIFLKECSEKLRYTSLYNINLGVKNVNINQNHWVYYPDESIPFFRIGSYSNVMSSMAPENRSSLYIEISYDPKMEFDRQATETKSIKKLIELGIICSEGEIETIQSNDIKCAYVIYDKNHKNVTGAVKEFLHKNEVFSIGRYGNWEYSSMEDALLQGESIAKRILDME